MDDIIKTVLDFMSGVKVPQRNFLLSLFTSLSCIVGRANYRNLSRHSGFCEHTYSRWYNREFDYAMLNRLLIEKELGKTGEKIGAIDATFLKKSGKCTEGLGMFWNGALGKSSRGLEVSTVAVIDLQSHTAYGLDSRMTQSGDDDCESRTIQYGKQVKELKEHLKSLRVRYLTTDAYYSKHEFTKTVIGAGLHQIGKLRHDAYLLWPYQGKSSGRGRPKKYAGIAGTKGELKGWKFIATLEDETLVYEGVVWSRALKSWVKVVIMRREEKGKQLQALLFSTDVELPALTIIEYYKLRFQIEFLFRDAKQHTGLGDCQGRKAIAQQNAANASITTLNLLKLEDRRAADTPEKTVISIESWKRRKANQQLMNLIFDTLEIDRTDKKVARTYEQFSNFGCIAA